VLHTQVRKFRHNVMIPFNCLENLKLTKNYTEHKCMLNFSLRSCLNTFRTTYIYRAGLEMRAETRVKSPIFLSDFN
jgi:hypothetical protein